MLRDVFDIIYCNFAMHHLTTAEKISTDFLNGAVKRVKFIFIILHIIHYFRPSYFIYNSLFSVDSSG